MSVVLATLIWVVTTAGPTTVDPEASVEFPGGIPASVELTVTPTLDPIAIIGLAGEASPAAAALEGERSALGCELNRDDAAACAQVGLIQAVLKELAEDRRDESARDAMDAFYRIIAMSQQSALLAESNQVLGDLLSLATRAEELDLPDGNTFDLKLQQLEIRDSQIVVQFGIKKLQRRLANLIDRPIAEVEVVNLQSTPLSHQPLLDETQAIATALQNRGDHQAALTLCRCMNADSLPAGKAMLGVLQPGLGLATVAGNLPLLAKLGQRDRNAANLACRRCQCQTLIDNSTELVTQQVTQAILELQEARERFEISSQLVQLATEKTQRQRAAEKIDKATAGSESIARLTALRRQADHIDRQRDVQIAEVNLQRALGTLVGNR